MSAPDCIVLKRHRDLAGRRHQVWTKRTLVTLVAAFVIGGLANAFGQRPTTSAASTPAATLSVDAPARLRGGLLAMARFRIDAHRELKDAVLVLDPGWLESMQINTIEPSPVGEASRNGRLALDLGHIAAGNHLTLYVELQVNPTNVGRRAQGVELDDGPAQLLRIDRTITVFP